MPRFDPARFNAALTTERFGRNLIFHPTVGSTMDVARDAASAGAPAGTVVVADEQTAGRGRLGRGWVTPAGLNLASTVVLLPQARHVRQMAMIAPLAVMRAVEDAADVHANIKWPNDVQVGGKKLAGILTETVETARGLAVLVGTGINVNFDPREHEEIREIATSLRAECGRAFEREPLLAAYLLHFERYDALVVSGGSVRDEWRERLVTLGQRVTVTAPGGVHEGTAEDVDSAGGLLLRTDAGALVTIDAGDVTLRR